MQRSQTYNASCRRQVALKAATVSLGLGRRGKGLPNYETLAKSCKCGVALALSDGAGFDRNPDMDAASKERCSANLIKILSAASPHGLVGLIRGRPADEASLHTAMGHLRHWDEAEHKALVESVSELRRLQNLTAAAKGSAVRTERSNPETGTAPLSSRGSNNLGLLLQLPSENDKGGENQPKKRQRSRSRSKSGEPNISESHPHRKGRLSRSRSPQRELHYTPANRDGGSVGQDPLSSDQCSLLPDLESVACSYDRRLGEVLVGLGVETRKTWFSMGELCFKHQAGVPKVWWWGFLPIIVTHLCYTSSQIMFENPQQCHPNPGRSYCRISRATRGCTTDLGRGSTSYSTRMMDPRAAFCHCPGAIPQGQ